MARSSERVRSSVDGDIQVPPWPQSCRRSIGQTVPAQPDNFVPGMMVAVLVLAEMAAVISRLVVALRSTPIYIQNAFPRRLRRLGTRPRLGNCAESHCRPGWTVLGWSHERGDADAKRTADTLGRAACRMAGPGRADPPG